MEQGNEFDIRDENLIPSKIIKGEKEKKEYEPRQFSSF